jgi:hypothetical protein
MMPMARAMRSSLVSPTPISFISGETISSSEGYCRRRFSTFSSTRLSKFITPFMPMVLILGDLDHRLVGGADEPRPRPSDSILEQLLRDHHAVRIEVEAIFTEESTS